MAFKAPRHVYFGPKDKDTGEPMEEPVYEYKEYPRVVYHADMGAMDVNSDEELKALGEGWQKAPIGGPHAPSQDELRAQKFAASAKLGKQAKA